MRCRKFKDDVKTGGFFDARISPEANLRAVWAASGIKMT
jgi:hypothetical protein